MSKKRAVLILAGVFFFLLHIPAYAEALQQELTLGVPAAGSFSGTGAENTYKVNVADGQYLFVVLDSDSSYNSYDLYIKFGSLPTTVDYDAKGASPNADQAVEIGNTQAGDYYILALSTSGAGNYTLTAHTNSTFPSLTVGTAMAGGLQATNDIKYYQFSAAAGEHLFATLDSDSSYNSYDLYVKFGSLPTTTNYDDKGASPNADQAVEIANTQAGYYYLMVRSTSGAGNYTLTADANSTFPSLTVGTAMAGGLQNTNDIKYYQFSAAAGEHLLAILDSDSSYNSYDLYIKFGSLPTTTNYDDKGASPNADQAVEIANTQAGYYYVMVRSTSGAGNYALTADANSTFPSLTLGTAMSGGLQNTNDIKYYQFSAAAGEHLFVTLDSDSSYNSYDLYIKFGALPTTVNYDARGASPNADQAVEIASAQAGYYYIMARSTSGAGNYALTADANSTFPSLTLGTAMAGGLQGTNDIKYSQVSAAAGEHLFVTLDSNSSYNSYDLYIKFGSLPTTIDYDARGESPNADQAVEIANTQAGYYYIMARSTSGAGNYALTADTNSTFPGLTLGTAKAGSLQGTNDIKYSQVSAAAGEHLFAILDSGSSYNSYDLYIKFGALPTTVDYDARGASPNADQAVEIASAQAGYYYIMVRSTSGTGNYALTTHTNSTFPTLIMGTAKAGSLQGTNDIKYSQVSAAAGEHLFFILDGNSSYNSYDLYIKFGSLPTTVDYDAKGEAPNADQAVEIASAQAGYYYVMVRSTSGGGDYTLAAHTNSTFPTLPSGTAKAGSLQGTNDIKYYQVSAAAKERLIIFLNGDSNYNTYDLYIKFGSLPTSTDYDVKGNTPNTNQSVEVASTQAGYYYIMVRSISGAGDYLIWAQFVRCIISLPVISKD